VVYPITGCRQRLPADGGRRELLWGRGEQLLSAPHTHGTPIKSSGRWRPPWVSPSRGNPWQPRPTAGAQAGWPAAPTPSGRRRPGCEGVLAGAGGQTRKGFTRTAAPMPGHRSWRDANRDGRGARTGESEPTRGARAGRAGGVRLGGGVPLGIRAPPEGVYQDAPRGLAPGAGEKTERFPFSHLRLATAGENENTRTHSSRAGARATYPLTTRARRRRRVRAPPPPAALAVTRVRS